MPSANLNGIVRVRIELTDMKSLRLTVINVVVILF
jgi:hypothetical protein